MYDPEREFNRMRLSDDWRLSDINKSYQFCDTYPAVLCVPAQITDSQLELIAEFRSKHRIPVLSWIDRSSSRSSPQKCPVIVRSSQPLCGMAGKRSIHDENYLEAIACLCERDTLYIMDARPYLNALANCTYGGGFENKTYYPKCRLEFLNIENIHAMRDSLGAHSDKDFFASLENSKWLEHIRMILDGAVKVVEAIKEGSSCLGNYNFICFFLK